MSAHPPVQSAKIPPGALPRDEAERIAWLRLTRSRRVGPATFIRLMRQFGSAREALRGLPGVAAEAGLRDYLPASRAEAEAEWRAGHDAGARALFLGAPDYPPLLAAISDPPPLLWALGDAGLGARPTVALVGARNASALGQRMAARLARELGAMGYVVASGLARGIDAAAHKASLATGTIAVHAGGVDDIYPPENAGLAAEIAAGGLRLSEMPIGQTPRPQHFPRRNRIVSGLALGIVVVEGAERSGSLITARAALDQGREVMAVPGSPLDPRAGGCNQLIREGATLVRSAEDVAEALGGGVAAAPAARPDPEPEPADPEGLAARLLALLGPSPIAEDALIRSTGLAPAPVLETLVELELEGRVARHPGGLISRPAE